MVNGGDGRFLNGTLAADESTAALVPLTELGLFCWEDDEWGGGDGRFSDDDDDDVVVVVVDSLTLLDTAVSRLPLFGRELSVFDFLLLPLFVVETLVGSSTTVASS